MGVFGKINFKYKYICTTPRDMAREDSNVANCKEETASFGVDNNNNDLFAVDEGIMIKNKYFVRASCVLLVRA